MIGVLVVVVLPVAFCWSLTWVTARFGSSGECSSPALFASAMVLPVAAVCVSGASVALAAPHSLVVAALLALAGLYLVYLSLGWMRYLGLQAVNG